MLDTRVTPEPEREDSAPRGAGPLTRGLRRLGLGPALTLLGYLVLTVLGATTSSIGVARLRQDPHHPLGTQFGPSRGLRSDEWLTITPMDLGRLATSGSSRADTPLSTAPDLIYQLPNHSLPETLVFFDGSLFRLGGVLPQPMLFAAWWWLPTLLLVLALPAWLRRLGARPHLAWLATGLVAFAPAAAWWSLFPVRVLGFAVAGSYLLIRAADHYLAGRRLPALGLAVVAGVLFARLPTFYVPWSITIGVPVVLATVAWLLWPASVRRAGLVVAACAGVTSLGLFGLLVLENRDAISASLNTVYPGLRRSTGAATNAAARFGAPLYGMFQRGPAAKGFNLSELSSAYTVTAAWALVVWVASKRRGWDRESAATGVLAAFTALWLVWCSVPLGGFGRHLPVVNRVTAVRAGQTVGFVAVLVLALVLSRAAGTVRAWVAATAALACAAVTLVGAIELRHLAARLDWVYITVTLMTVALLVFLITWLRDRAWPVALGVVVAALQVLWANPLILGLGDLRDSDGAKFARAVGEQAHADGRLWATDDLMADALFIANGVPMLSGHQVTGPVQDEWHKLDPTGTFANVWNRGVSYVVFRWSGDAEPKIAVVGKDLILIKVDPCRLPALGFPVAGIVTRRQLENSCLVPDRPYTWIGKPMYTYRISTR